MNTIREQHLNETQLLQAAVDTADLPDAFRTHLVHCALCRAEKERFENELRHLGATAKHLTPKPPPRITLPRQEKRSSLWYLLRSHGVIGTTLAAAAVALVLVGTYTYMMRTTPIETNAPSAQEMLEARQLMTEVNMLVENALPPVYLDIAGEPSAAYDEEFMRFLIPATESDSLTSTLEKRGLA